MTHVPGSAPAKLLARLGLSRGEIVDALMTDFGLTYADADRAWWSTAPRYQAVHSGRYRARPTAFRETAATSPTPSPKTGGQGRSSVGRRSPGGSEAEAVERRATARSRRPPKTRSCTPPGTAISSLCSPTTCSPRKPPKPPPAGSRHGGATPLAAHARFGPSGKRDRSLPTRGRFPTG